MDGFICRLGSWFRPSPALIRSVHGHGIVCTIKGSTISSIYLWYILLVLVVIASGLLTSLDISRDMCIHDGQDKFMIRMIFL